MRGPHDVGGLPAGKVDPSDHPAADWEQRAQAMSGLLRGALPVPRGPRGPEVATARPGGHPLRPGGLDEMRRHGEELGERYRSLAYGERNIHALAEALIRRGVIQVDELAQALARQAAADDRIPPDSSGKRHHDVGGAPAPACDRRNHPRQPWERRTDALMMVLSDLPAPDRGSVPSADEQDAQTPRMLRADQDRRVIEALGPQAYRNLPYYAKWSHAIAGILLETGVVTTAELMDRMDQDRVPPGDPVRR